MRLPTIALSIQQPWAWLIVNGHKAVENRTWRHSHRGPVLIHAGKVSDAWALAQLKRGVHPVTGAHGEAPALNCGVSLCGGIVGMAEVVDCVERHDSPWFVGPFAFVLANARPLPFTPLRGHLGFFKVPPGVVQQ